MLSLQKTIYSLEESAQSQVIERLIKIEERVGTLRSTGIMTDATLRDYYGEKRFEQVAESNAIEGSTLSVGETELAVLKGVTISGHDPAYARDAIALDAALTKIAEIARIKDRPTDISQLREIHALILGDRKGAGVFRNEEIIITGSSHQPPRNWSEIMDHMERWEQWSLKNAELPAPIRSLILHAWLTHIHPYIDGNGRVARAIGNLELIRGGYPPIIIKKKERDRYIDALGESDYAGDIRSFAELVFERIEGALIGLESSARRKQDYNPIIERLRAQQEQQLKIWSTSVMQLADIIKYKISSKIEELGGKCTIKNFDALDLVDYISLSNNSSVARSWAFIVTVTIPGFEKFEKLAYIINRSQLMRKSFKDQGGPSIQWSSPNPTGFPKWIADGEKFPSCVEASTSPVDGNEWFVRNSQDKITKIGTMNLAENLANSLLNAILEKSE
jgi:Fic family protein